MSDTPYREKMPVGIDLGNEITSVAVAADVESLKIEIEETVPTRVSVTDEGFVIPDRDSERHESGLSPLSHIDDTSPQSSSNDLPLPLFFQLLFDRLTPIKRQSDSSETANEEEPSITGDSSERSQQMEDSDTDDESQSQSNNGVDGDDDYPTESNGFEISPTTITVPGGYSGADMVAVERAASAAGFENVQVVRSPVTVAATELLETDTQQTIAVADIGRTQASIAIVTIDDEELSVRSRTTLPDYGWSSLKDILARWILTRIETEWDVSLDCDPDAMARLRTAAGDALHVIDPDGEATATINVELSDGITVTEGGVFTSKPITFQSEVDLQTVIQALHDELQKLQDTIWDLRAATDTEEVDSLLLAGKGAEVAAIVIAVENAFEQRSQFPQIGDEQTSAAFGAALLSCRRNQESPVVQRETFASELALRAIGDDSVVDRSITTPDAGAGDELTGRLDVLSDDHLSGSFQVVRRHRITGATKPEATFTCTGFPSNMAESELVVTVAADNVRISEAVIDVDVESSLHSDRSVSLSVNRKEEILGPWLGHADADPKVETVDEWAGEGSTPDFEFISDREKALRDFDDESVAKTLLKIRNKLRNKTHRYEDSVPIDDIKLLLEEFDKNLQFEDIQIIQPEAGSEVDPEEQSVIDTDETTSEPEGTVLEVVSLGIAIDGVLIEPAEVIAAK